MEITDGYRTVRIWAYMWQDTYNGFEGRPVSVDTIPGNCGFVYNSETNSYYAPDVGEVIDNCENWCSDDPVNRIFGYERCCI